ncbi:MULTISPECIES: hypothetical protein [Kitasatospora]|uniref:hypothetical protein n=1 Tax=Kitasatospora TaxID=2063 RepID=UPI000C7099B5|nr:hypothetical protein [Kitasatospora sp. GP30]MDH6139267.1 hypothetical protein [Kitasatospora sp. GP30]
MSSDDRDDGPRVHYGDQVSIHGGSKHIGIQHNHGRGGDEGLPPEIAAMFAQLATLVTQLAVDSRVGDEDRQSLTETLPVLSQPARAERRHWRNTLYLLTNLARDIGDAAAPMLGLATQLISLIRA